MWQYNTNPNSDELYHHGILGQKWGKKSGPPYPLDASDHTAAERKAGWRKSLDKNTKNKTKEDSTFDEYYKGGSKKTKKMFDKTMAYTKKIDVKKSSFNGDRATQKARKYSNKYAKSVDKDIEKAIKKNDMKTANRLLAGKTYVKLMYDEGFQRSVLDLATEKAKVSAGETFTANFIKNNKQGDVTVIINDKKVTSAQLVNSKEDKLLANRM